jgi:hypothetical protein
MHGYKDTNSNDHVGFVLKIIMLHLSSNPRIQRRICMCDVVSDFSSTDALGPSIP